MYALFVTADGRFAFSDIDNGGVEITDAEHAALLSAQGLGKIIVPDADGRPVAVDPPAPTAEEQARIIRAQRDALLTACDWTQLPDSPLPAATKTAWATYRQDLRDITGQAGFPASVTWPVAPGA